MEKEEENKNKTPHRMSRIAFPKAKYGVFLAVSSYFACFNNTLQRFNIIIN